MSHQVGDTVYALCTVGDSPSGDSPGGVYCKFGEELVIRTLFNTGDYGVSHPNVTDGQTFIVHPNEISKMRHFDHNNRLAEYWRFPLEWD